MVLSVAALTLATSLGAQTGSAAELQSLVAGLTVTPRVLVVGMHPDDEDSQLLAWLARGKHVQTAYLSISRGEAAGNFLGAASGVTLGAVRTQESLLARKIDGAEQFFTRVYDFGFARTDSILWTRWNRDSLLSDVVTVVRTFRPHVVVINTPTDTADHDVQHAALERLVTDAITLAQDETKRHPLDYGDAWTVSKAYVRDRAVGMVINADEYDPILGVTYANVARRARSMYRSQGLGDLVKPKSPTIALKRILPNDTGKDSLFLDGIVSTYARFLSSPSDIVRQSIKSFLNYADSASRTSDRQLEYLGIVARSANQMRAELPSCRHPARALRNRRSAFQCSQDMLDQDAAVDVFVERANAALLNAARVSLDATSDRELVAESDTAPVSVVVTNFGSAPVKVERVAAWGDVDTTTVSGQIDAGQRTVFVRRIVNLTQKYQWWTGVRNANRYPASYPQLDGVTRERRSLTDTTTRDPAGMIANGLITMLQVSGVAIPEQLRRTSDVQITLTVAGATFTTSITPVFRYADEIVGLQERPLAGVPNVTLNLNRALEWVAADKPVDRGVHVNIASHTKNWSSLRLRVVSPAGMRDSLFPSAFRLAPREQRDVTVSLKGAMPAGEKQEFGVIGNTGSGPFAMGFRTTQYPHILPIRSSWQSGMWIQPVEVTVPRTLVVVYVTGVSDDVSMALQDIGVSVAVYSSATDLLQMDLKRVTTLVFGPRAFEAHPELLQQMPRFMNWVRNSGGTIVVQRGGEQTLRSGALPYFVDLGNPATTSVTQLDAPVTRIAAAPTVLQWPNIIKPADWEGWLGPRAHVVPTQVDPAYQSVIETHDAGQKPNKNSLLVSRVGKGLFIYSALTLDEQIAGGVPGALRLLVNLMSAGLTPPGAK